MGSPTFIHSRSSDGKEEGKFCLSNFPLLRKIGIWFDFRLARVQCHSIVLPGEGLALDEMMILATMPNLFSSWMPLKPSVRRGTKPIALCWSWNGESYVYDFHVARSEGKYGPYVNPEWSVSQIMVAAAVGTPSLPVGHTGRKIFMDLGFNSENVLSVIRELDHFGCGTVQSNRGVPEQIKFAGQYLATHTLIGDFHFQCKNTDKPSLTCWVWLDHGDKGCLFMSNYHEPQDSNNPSHVMRKRRDAEGRVERDAPAIAIDYNAKMGGVDDCDRQRAFFSTKRRSHKWWFPIFTLSLDNAINNAWMIYKRYNVTTGNRKDGCKIKTRRKIKTRSPSHYYAWVHSRLHTLPPRVQEGLLQAMREHGRWAHMCTFRVPAVRVSVSA